MQTSTQTSKDSNKFASQFHRLRILVGTHEIGGVIPIFADGFRKLGHQVTTAICDRNPFYPEIQYDVDICSEIVHWSWRVNRALQLSSLPRLIASHNVFVFQWAGISLLNDNLEYPLLKFLGKRIVSIFNGDDARHALAYAQDALTFYGQEGAAYILSPDHQERLTKDPLTRPLRNTRQAERYSDLIISVPCISVLAVRPYMHFFIPIKLSEYVEKIPQRERPVVVHAPSNKKVKGTEIILPVLERLRLEGVPFELRLMHGIPNHKVRLELSDADMVVDQLYFPLHGLLGLEAMATGCALASSNREDYEPFPPNRPIWHVDPGNLYIQLKRLLTDKELRVRLAREGRKYVETYHDHVKVAKRIIESLNANKFGPKRYDHYPSFFARRFQLPQGVVIPKDLQRITAEIVQHWGLPQGVDPQDLINRGLMSSTGLKRGKPIPRWKLGAEKAPSF